MDFNILFCLTCKKKFCTNDTVLTEILIYLFPKWVNTYPNSNVSLFLNVLCVIHDYVFYKAVRRLCIEVKICAVKEIKASSGEGPVGLCITDGQNLLNFHKLQLQDHNAYCIIGASKLGMYSPPKASNDFSNLAKKYIIELIIVMQQFFWVICPGFILFVTSHIFSK